MFRETDETVTEPMFINLSFVQAQHDYLQVRDEMFGSLSVRQQPTAKLDRSLGQAVASNLNCLLRKHDPLHNLWSFFT